MVASRKMQEAQPRIKALREQYPGRDMESRTKLEQEMRKVFKEMGVRQSDSLWPILIQMPVILALFQALSRVDFLRQVISYGLTLVVWIQPLFFRF